MLKVDSEYPFYYSKAEKWNFVIFFGSCKASLFGVSLYIQGAEAKHMHFEFLRFFKNRLECRAISSLKWSNGSKLLFLLQKFKLWKFKYRTL